MSRTHNCEENKDIVMEKDKNLQFGKSSKWFNYHHVATKVEVFEEKEFITQQVEKSVFKKS